MKTLVSAWRLESMKALVSVWSLALAWRWVPQFREPAPYRLPRNQSLRVLALPG